MQLRRIVLMSLIAGATSAAALAYPVTFEFTGEVSGLSDPYGVLGDAVSLGDLLGGSYTFESTTPDSEPDDPAHGMYKGTLISLSGDIGQISFSLPIERFSRISIFNDFSTSGDSYSLRTEVDSLSEASIFRFTLLDEDALLFSDDSLPVWPPDLSLLETNFFQLYSESEGAAFGVGGTITSLTPEPGTLSLLITVVFLTARRQTRC